MRKIEVVVAKNASEAREYMDQGYCPIECSFGEESVVDELKMDHHGSFSHLRPVCIRAVGPALWGVRASDRRFVVAGGPDADACLAILALCGATTENPHTPGEVIDLYRLAARRDRDPHVNLVEACRGDDSAYNGDVVLLWFLQQRFRCWNEAIEGLQLAFKKWRRKSSYPGFFDDCFEKEKQRIEQAKTDMEAGESYLLPEVGSSILLVAPQGGFGFDVFYRSYDFVVQMNNSFSSVTVGAKDEETAKRLGGDGLRKVFKELSVYSPGWGGSPTVGGSPRGVEMTILDAFRAVQVISCFLEREGSHQETYEMLRPHLQL